MGNCLKCLQVQTERNQTMSSSTAVAAATTATSHPEAVTALAVVNNGGTIAGSNHSTKQQQQQQQQINRYNHQHLYIAYPQATDNEHIKSSTLSSTTATIATTPTPTTTTINHYPKQQQNKNHCSANEVKAEETEMSHLSNRLSTFKNFGQHCEIKRSSFKKSLAFLANGNLIGGGTAVTSNSMATSTVETTNSVSAIRAGGTVVHNSNTGQQSKISKSTINAFHKTPEVCDNKLNQLFEEYKDPDDDLILAEGIERLCLDLNYQPDEFAILVLAWCLNASQMCRFTRTEFIEGLQKMKADTIPSIRCRLEETIEKLGADAELFKQLYRFTFRFGLEPEQRILSLDMAICLWRLVFTVQTPVNLIGNWLHFLEQHPNIRGIPKDTWNMFLNFSEQCDIDKYDDTEAWPSLFDDFVDYERYRLLNMNSKTSVESVANNCTNVDALLYPSATMTTLSSSLSTPTETTSTRPNSMVINETSPKVGNESSTCPDDKELYRTSASSSPLPSNCYRSNDIL